MEFLIKKIEQKPKEDNKIITIKTTRFDLVESQFRLKGDKFDFKGKEYLKSIINMMPPKMLLKTGRQVEKSTTISNKIVSQLISHPKMRMSYIAPIWKQTEVFVKDRLHPLLNTSPFIKEYYVEGEYAAIKVEQVTLANMATCFMRSTFGTGTDSIRGLSNDMINYDEIQDILADNIPVINESLSHSSYVHPTGEKGFVMYAGTPKSNDNTIEGLWQGSTQNHLGIKCGCGKWIIGGGVENISDLGFVCHHCNRIIDLRTAKKQWVRAYDRDRTHPIEGFHLSQLMMPWIAWSEVLSKFKGGDAYPTARFYNEVLGYSYDDSAKVFTLDDFLNRFFQRDPQCDNFADVQKKYGSKHKTVYLGMDWGTGGQSSSVLYAMVNHGVRLIPIEIKKFSGQEAKGSFQLDYIKNVLRNVPNSVIGLDYGHGYFQNTELLDLFGPERVHIFYHSQSQKDVLRYNAAKGIYTTARTDVLTKLFNMIRNGEIAFIGAVDMFMEYWKDFLAVGMEYSTRLRVYTYIHNPNNPDDGVHACLYATLVFLLKTGQMRPTLSQDPNMIQ